MLSARSGQSRAGWAPTDLPVCLQCGIPAGRPGAASCRRCGLPFGAAPRESGELAVCPMCYRSTDDDGRLASLADAGRRLDLVAHVAEHDRFPVGDDEWLESLRQGDRVRIGRWTAPFDLVRRYLVTGVVHAGRTRREQHDTLVMAMTQLARWGPTGGSPVGDQPEWAEARLALAQAMERYHRGRA
jgi:hypothetical protein